MKKFIVLTAALVFMSSSAFALIANSGHDFTGTFTNDICAPCHVPHNGTTGVGPLWSHSSATATSFTMYSNATIDMTIAGSPQAESLACLSCHDGETNLDDFIGSATTGTTMTAGIAANLGTDLSDDHPISITYDTAQDAAYNTIANATADGIVFYCACSNQVECASCHDVHNSFDVAPLLRFSNAGSNMCLACHIK
ncbi:MAG: cytochrome C [Desulfuromonas sp.]|nr:MAG: cytochrome C [Desulfuromonas sp.]